MSADILSITPLSYQEDKFQMLEKSTLTASVALPAVLFPKGYSIFTKFHKEFYSLEISPHSARMIDISLLAFLSPAWETALAAFMKFLNLLMKS